MPQPLLFSSLLATLILCQVAADPPIDPGYFAPTQRVTGILYPNPANPTCEVLMGIKQTSAVRTSARQPSATQVPDQVNGTVSLQLQNLQAAAYNDGFQVTVEFPADVIITNVAGATLGASQTGSNNTVAYPLRSPLALPASGAASTFINTTVTAKTQDFTPRNVLLEGARCALALAGFKPSDLPAAVNLGPILAAIPPLPTNPTNP